MSFNFMAAITICSDFGAQKIKSATVSTVSPSICHEVMGPKIRDIKGTFHAKMGSIQDRNVMDQTKAEDIKTRWQEYTEELHKILQDPDNYDGVQRSV